MFPILPFYNKIINLTKLTKKIIKNYLFKNNSIVHKMATALLGAENIFQYTVILPETGYYLGAGIYLFSSKNLKYIYIIY